MITERTQNRQIYISTAINLIPDTVIALISAQFSNDPVLVFFGVLIGLQVVYLLIWIKNSLWSWLRYAVYDKKKIVKTLLNFLTMNKMPKPNEYLDKSDTYFEDVASNDENSIEVRLAAALELGALKYLQGTMRLQEYLRISLPYDAALEEYSRKLRE